MLCDKVQSQINNRMYQQSVEEYERRQRQLESLRLKNQLSQSRPNSLPNQSSILVGGEPVLSADKNGNAVFNKMKKIDENFDEIQYLVIISC